MPDRPAPPLAVAVVAAASGVLAMFADASPVGTTGPDLAWRVAVGVLVPLVASRSGPVGWFALPVAAAAFTTTFPTLALLATTCAAAVVATRSSNRTELGALVGAIGAQLWFHLDSAGPEGASAAAALAGFVVLSASSVRRNRLPVGHRGLRTAVIATVVVCGAGGVGAAVTLSQARDDLDAAAASVRTALASVRAGDDSAARTHLEDATEALRAARGHLDHPAGALARLTPVVAQQRTFASVATDTATSVVALAVDALDSLDPEALRPVGGRLDLEAVAVLLPPVDAMLDRMSSARAAVAATDSPWLLPRVDELRDRLLEEIDEADRLARPVTVALRHAGELLGGEGRRRYLVLFGNPAEARELGGFIGGQGVLTATDGELDFDGSVDREALEMGLARSDAGPGDLPAGTPQPFRDASPWRFSRNWSAWPDFGVVARVTSKLYQQATGQRIDGVVYVDPYVLATMLRFTGPVALEGTDVELSASTAVEVLIDEQYGFPESDHSERRDRLQDAAELIFDRLVDGALPRPRRLTEELGPLVASRRLLLAVPDAPEDFRRLLDDSGLSGDLGEEDVLLTLTNFAENKLDAHVHSDVTVTRRSAQTGQVVTSVRARIHNRAQPDRLSAYALGSFTRDRRLPLGSAQLTVALHSPIPVRVVEVSGTASRAPRTVTAIPDGWRAATSVDIPPEEMVTVTFEIGPHATDRALVLLPTASARALSWRGFGDTGDFTPLARPQRLSPIPLPAEPQ